MYLEMAQVEDEKSVQNWNAVVNSSLTFSGLFSAVVATFLGISVQDLKPDPQDKPAFYLDNIYQLLADYNKTHAPTLPTQSNPFTFSPPKSAILVNSLWFLSLVITLSCALLAILLQQWTCRYIKLTQPRSANSPHQRARIREFFDKGVEDLRLQWTVDALPILLHASLVLFLAGLLIYTIGSNRTVFDVVVFWVGLCTVVYACFTLIPIFRHDSPYYTPLSSPLRLLCICAGYVVALILWCLTAFNCCNDEIWHRFGRSKDNYQRQLYHGIERVAEERSRDSSSKIDGWVLLWTLRSSQDDELEQLFASILCNSSKFLAGSKTSIREKTAEAVVGLMHRTLSSDLDPQTKQDRIMICNETTAKVPLINQRILERVLHGDWSGLLCSVEFGLMLTKARYSDQFAKYYSQCVVSVIISRVQEHDGHWFELATSHLDIRTDTLQDYLAHGDSMLLANCNFICRRTMEDYSRPDWRCDIYARSTTLELVSKFNIQGTLPELQQEFCDMWNKLVQNTGNRDLSIYILKHIRNVYCRLHQGTNTAPTEFSSTTSDHASVLLFLRSYPLCKIAHRPAKEPFPKDVPVQQNSTSATPKTPSARQDGAYNPSTPGGASVVTLFPTHAGSSSQASPRLPSGIVASPHSPDLRSPSQPNHSSSSRLTSPIGLLPLPVTSSRAPLQSGCGAESGFGTSVAWSIAHKDWTLIPTTPTKEVYAV
ncbi:hypothetical protein EDB86DRAFT_1405179 [Lactarius hatsudake]|nr:hypothetical protein EDB86DRAFT_1405179 [Lactarius hatsudake]